MIRHVIQAGIIVPVAVAGHSPGSNVFPFFISTPESFNSPVRYLIRKSRLLYVFSGQPPFFSQLHKPFVLSLQVLTVNPASRSVSPDGLPVK